jgi:hypothetical protein
LEVAELDAIENELLNPAKPLLAVVVAVPTAVGWPVSLATTGCGFVPDWLAAFCPFPFAGSGFTFESIKAPP